SANVMQGNTVLVGHLTGAAGAVFNKLDSLEPGDRIVAVSRGLDYSFVVSDKQVLPFDDSGPTQTDSRPRLTLMTCTGTWDPLTRTYSDRLWITAEPPPEAQATITANAAAAARAATATAMPTGPLTTADLSVTGVGAARSLLDRRWGPPVGETPNKLV